MIADAYEKKTALPRPLRVLMVSAEIAPFARSGGLGDVMQGLPRALGSMGIEVTVVTPYYGALTSLQYTPGPQPWPRPLWTHIGGDVREVGVLETIVAGDVHVLLLDCPSLFQRDGIYGNSHGDFPDNDFRFAVLSAASLRAAEVLWNGPPDVLHAHDWHAALSIVYARLSEDEAWGQAPSVLTIHNLAFQGLHPLDRAAALGLPTSIMHPEALRHGDCMNLLKGGIVYSDRVTTVSPSYAREIITTEHGCGLDHSLRARSHQLVGIVNGIDVDVWNPARDRALSARYDAHDPSGRRACKIALGAELGLDLSNNPPIIGIVSRLTQQKGIDMLLDIMPGLVDDGVRFAIIAFGDADLEQRLGEAAKRWPRHVGFRRVFGDPIARRVYAGADIFVMPSRFEPCGLGQQYAMRYGAIPIVNAVGGMQDTVEQVNEERATGTGFLMQDTTPEALDATIRRALTALKNRPLWDKLLRNAMLRDGSWDASARSYFAMYRELVGAPPRPSLPPPLPVGFDTAEADVLGDASHNVDPIPSIPRN